MQQQARINKQHGKYRGVYVDRDKPCCSITVKLNVLLMLNVQWIAASNTARADMCRAFNMFSLIWPASQHQIQAEPQSTSGKNCFSCFSKWQWDDNNTRLKWFQDNVLLASGGKTSLFLFQDIYFMFNVWLMASFTRHYGGVFIAPMFRLKAVCVRESGKTTEIDWGFV